MTDEVVRKVRRVRKVQRVECDMKSEMRPSCAHIMPPISDFRSPTPDFRQPTTDNRQPPANIAAILSQRAAERPGQAAVLDPIGQGFAPIRYRTTTFCDLDDQTDRLAADVLQRGVTPGMKLVLFVPFSTAFIAWTFALLKAGVIVVLIDPGMGRNNIFRCLEEVEPDGFVAIRRVQWIRSLMRRRFPKARFNITVRPHASLMVSQPSSVNLPATSPHDPAAIIFTSGSTGPPKGVLYEHGMFAAQARLIQDFYGIEPGEIDLPGFPLFGLFNAAMGVTTVIPQMDPTRPARVDPRKILAAIEQQQVTQAFGSPAFWNRVGRYCEEQRVVLPGIKRAMSAGGPVPVHVVHRVSSVLTQPAADLYTPYGATECLPVASIGARDVLEQTAARTETGAGTCVGRPFPEVEIAIIEATDAPLSSITAARILPAGQIGEIIVRSPAATREYYRRPEGTALAKIPDLSGPAIGRPDFWHRMGDVGYFDEEGRLWFCGRKAHIVHTEQGPMYSVCCEGIFDAHPGVYRSALVGIGPRPAQTPVLVVEPEPQVSKSARDSLVGDLLRLAASQPLTSAVRTVLLHPSLPVDTRHNVKINREELATWATQEIQMRPKHVSHDGV